MTEWQQKAAIWASTIRYVRTIQSAVESLIYGLMKDGADAGMVKFKTNGGRPCVLVIGIGADAAKDAEALYKKLHKKHKKESNGETET